MAIKRYTLEQIKQLEGKSDTERLRSMTDEEIEAAAASDPDCPLLTDEELREFRPGQMWLNRRDQGDKV